MSNLEVDLGVFIGNEEEIFILIFIFEFKEGNVVVKILKVEGMYF